MDQNQPSEPLVATVAYYDEHADEFAARTRDLDLSSLYEQFLPLIPPGGHILDAGCGTGRDSEAFTKRGYQVLACDISEAMVKMASQRLGRPVLRLSFWQFDFHHEFDGIWACASLLHVPKSAMPFVFGNLHRALKPGGVLYASFKRGDREEFREGRWFSDFTEESLQAFLEGLRHHWWWKAEQNWSLLKVWRTEDIRQMRPNVEWVNVLLRAEERPQ